MWGRGPVAGWCLELSFKIYLCCAHAGLFAVLPEMASLSAESGARGFVAPGSEDQVAESKRIYTWMGQSLLRRLNLR